MPDLNVHIYKSCEVKNKVCELIHACTAYIQPSKGSRNAKSAMSERAGVSAMNFGKEKFRQIIPHVSGTSETQDQEVGGWHIIGEA